MMQSLHNLSRSWFATLLMGGLALSFVVWGIADVFTGSTSTAVASVGSTEIDQRAFMRSYKNVLRAAEQQNGQPVSPEMAQRLGLGPIALQQMIDRAAVDNEATRLGLVTPFAVVQQSIQAMPALRGATGRFDPTVYARALQNADYSEPDFIKEMRGDLTRSQLTGAVEGNYVIPPGYAQALFLYINEKRAADYVIVSPDSLGAIPPPSEAVLAAYVKANAARFSTPEYRDVDFAEIGPEDLFSQITVTDQQIQQEFDAHKAAYIVPEKRDLQQLPFPSEAEANAAEAKLKAGTSFDALIQSRGFKPADIASTVVESDLGDADTAKAAFALPLNGVSVPLKSTFGYELVRVTKIVPGSNKSFADVKDDIRKALATQIAGGKLVDIANAFEDARSGGASIAQAAKKTGMKAGHVAAIDASGKAPDGSPAAAPQDPEFLTQVFRSEVGEDSDPFPAKSGHYYAIRVNGVTPPKVKSLEQVRAAATAAWTDEMKAKLLTVRAAQLAAQAAKDNSLDGIAKSLKLPVQHSPALSRNTNDTMFSAAVTQKLFAAKPGGIVSGPQGQSGNFIIAKVTGIAHPPILPGSPGFAQGAQQLSQAMSGDFSLALANAARTRQGVKINQKLMDSAIGGGT
jgi:peptidyl-prolyl cis-trans isomerase D